MSAPKKTVSYKELGLVNTKKMFEKAVAGGFAIPAYNFNNMEQLQAIIGACVESKSPVILQVSAGARQYANQTLLMYMAKGFSFFFFAFLFVYNEFFF